MKISIGAKPLLYPLPVLLVGTYDENGKPNLMNAAFGGLCAHNPPALTVSIRPATWTHHCILERKAFTVNIPSAALVREADYVGLVSGKTEDKFTAGALTPVKSELVDAPYAGECPVVVECGLLKHVDVGSHTIFVGQIMDVKVDEGVLGYDGQTPDIYKIDPLSFDFGGHYVRMGESVGVPFSIGKALKK